MGFPLGGKTPRGGSGGGTDPKTPRGGSGGGRDLAMISFKPLGGLRPLGESSYWIGIGEILRLIWKGFTLGDM